MPLRLPVYFDYNATTPHDPAVIAAMLPFLTEHFGNPSSTHAYGRLAHQAVEKARQQVADLIGAAQQEILFTATGTEATNLAIQGLVGKQSDKRKQIIISSVEHPATMQPCLRLAELGHPIVVLPVDQFGVVEMDALQEALKQPTLLVSIMHSNNEVGTLQPVREIATLAHQAGALVHTDVAQSLGKLPMDVDALQVDLLTIAGHKLYAPKGIGALYVRSGVSLQPVIHGAGHERGLRAGTENVPYIVGLGQAAEVAQHFQHDATRRLIEHRDHLWKLLQDRLGGCITLHGHPTERLPNTINFSIAGWIGDELLEACPTIAGSTGSACHAGKIDVSAVLAAMGVKTSVARGAIRLSVGRFTTTEEVEYAAETLLDVVVSNM